MMMSSMDFTNDAKFSQWIEFLTIAYKEATFYWDSSPVSFRFLVAHAQSRCLIRTDVAYLEIKRNRRARAARKEINKKDVKDNGRPELVAR